MDRPKPAGRPLKPVIEPFVWTLAHVECVRLGLTRWPDGAYIELAPNGRGGVRVSVLAERPKWDPVKGDPDRPGTKARPMRPDERGLDLDQIKAAIERPIAHPMVELAGHLPV